MNNILEQEFLDDRKDQNQKRLQQFSSIVKGLDCETYIEQSTMDKGPDQQKEEIQFLVKDLDTGDVFDIRESVVENFSVIKTEKKHIWGWNKFKTQSQRFFDYAELGQLQDLSQLISEQPALINSKLNNDLSALHLSAQYGHLQLSQFLIQNGAFPDVQNKNNKTPLHLAAIKGYFDICQLLVNTGCNINIQDRDRYTALHYASENGHLQSVSVILQSSNVDYKILNNFGLSAYQIAANIEIREMFVHFKAIYYSHNYHKTQMGKSLLTNSRIDHVNRCLQQLMTKRKNPPKPLKKLKMIDSIGPENFKYYKLLGKGSFGQVYLVQYENEFFAMKVLLKKKIQGDGLIKYAQTEKNVLKQGEHPFLVKLKFAFQNNQNLFMVMELCPNGDLGKYLVKKKKLTENEARFFICEIVLGIGYLHSLNYIYRDLKPDNIVIDVNGHAKITDFGLSKQVKPDNLQNSFCGSVAYLAPEIIRRSGHNKTIDWYLVGVLLYEMLVGIPPFYCQSRDKLFQNISSAKLKVPSYISPFGQDLIYKLMTRDITQRLGAKKDVDEIKAHPWFQDIDWQDVYDMKLTPPEGLVKEQQAGQEMGNLFSSNQSKNNVYKDWSFIAN